MTGTFLDDTLPPLRQLCADEPAAVRVDDVPSIFSTPQLRLRHRHRA